MLSDQGEVGLYFLVTMVTWIVFLCFAEALRLSEAPHLYMCALILTMVTPSIFAMHVVNWKFPWRALWRELTNR